MDADRVVFARHRFLQAQARVFAGPSGSLANATEIDTALAELLEAGLDLAALGEDPRDGGRVALFAQGIEAQSREIAALRRALADRETEIAARDAELATLRKETRP